MGRFRSTNLAALVGIVTVVAGLFLSAALVGSRQRMVDAAPTAMVLSAADIGGDGGTVEENRALKPVIFVGRVAAADGEVDIGIEEPFTLPVYTVDVETSLKGQLPSRFRVAVLTSAPPEELGGDAVVVGDRYLFAAEVPDTQGMLWIDEGLGSVRVADDNAAAAIIAKYQQLIVEVTANPPPPPVYEPFDLIETNPTIDIDPSEGRAGRNVRVTVKRAVGPVTVYWRNRHNRVGREDVGGDDCRANLQIRVPSDARPGRYDIIAIDARGKEVHERFHVLDD